jgi:ATP/maltotriose-dependent transcriptional regulator MalT
MLATTAEAARHGPPAVEPQDASDLLLDALAIQLTEGFSAAAKRIKNALGAFCAESDRDMRESRWQWMASRAAVVLFDDDALEVLSARYVQFARDDGALSVLPTTLNHLAGVRVNQGALSEAALLLDEADRITSATGGPRMLVARALLLAYREDDDAFHVVYDDLQREASARSDGASMSGGAWTYAVFHNARGNYESALTAAKEASALEPLGISGWVLPELVEAASRCGRRDEASAGMEQLSERARVAGTDLAWGFEAAARGLLNEDEGTETAYREAVERLGRTRMRLSAARARLLYGEWLRRKGRRADARAELRAAHAFFEEAGAGAFAERARRELAATGEKVTKRSPELRSVLTPQEVQIARLARDGHSNPEIGAMLFLSPRTVEWHLRKVFTKLEITSRRQLKTALPERSPLIVST